MGYKGITQIVLILVGIIVAFSFTQPVLTNARGLQDDIAEYRNALEKASELNSRLQELVATRDSFDPAQLQALQRMLPAKIDQLAVMHEIEAIFAIRDMDIISLTASDVVDPVGDDLLLEAATIEDIPESQGLSYQDFTIEFSGTYAQMRDLLVLFEASASLYEVMELPNQAATHKIEAIAAETNEGSRVIDQDKLVGQLQTTDLQTRDTKSITAATEKAKLDDAQTKTGSGGRGTSDIGIVFNKNKASLYALYERERRKNSSLKGRIVFQLTIEPSGKVSSVKVVSSELNNPDLEARILARIKLFVFAPVPGETVTVTYPVEFIPS